MLKRSFEVFSIDLEILNLLGAFHTKKDPFNKTIPFYCSFSYEQSRILPRNNKLNTQLFEQLTEIIGIPYKVSHNILSDFLYECIFVDMNVRGLDSTLCLLEKDASGKTSAVKPVTQDAIIQNMYTYGFTISGVPKRDPVTKERACGTLCDTEDIHYRAFIASASMSRKGIYLFVNEKHYRQLLERLSLGFFSFSEEEKRIIVPEGRFKDSFKISPSKVSAYLGLMLSDGVSMKEARTAWKNTDSLCSTEAPELTLDENTVFVAHDLEVPAKRLFSRNGSHVWLFDEASSALKDVTGCELKDEEAASLMKVFRFLSKERKWNAADLNSWKRIVISYIEKGKLLNWYGMLPAIPQDDAAFQKKLCHYAYLLASFLYKNLCDYVKNAPTDQKIWSENDVLETRIANLIDSLADNQDVRNALCNVKDSHDILSITEKTKDEDSGESASEDSSKSASEDSQSLKTRKNRALIFEYGEKSKTKMYEAKLVPTESLTKDINLFDGMGLCDFATFDILEKLLLRTNTLSAKRRYSALIIRLPWLKGVLVRCDFQRFFKEHCPSIPDKIKDAFGYERKLEDIRIIVNESMLKGIKYLKNAKNINPEDPWAYYWKMISQNGYQLLITGRNSPAGNTARLNNQFLSTISLLDGEMDTLVARNIEKLKKYLQDETSKKQFFTHGTSVEADEYDADDNDQDDHDTPRPLASQGINTDDVFGSALKLKGESVAALQKGLLGTRYARGSLQSHIRSRIVDCLQGRLEIDADYRFVAPDLVCMLHYLNDRYLLRIHQNTNEKNYYKTIYKLNSAINEPRQASYRGHGFFYAPGKNAPWKNSQDGDICALRNPHYSLGEGTILTALNSSDTREYDKWFSHLDSCIQLPATAASTMGGADFDGDRCLCVAEPCIIEAVKRSIRRNADALVYILQNKDRYIGFLDDQLDKTAEHLPAAQYLTDVKAWLDSCLPASYTPDRDAYCPPLYFGLDNHGIEFTPKEKNIEKYLFNTFIMTTQQQIGMLSIEALKLTGSAYLTPPENTDSKEDEILKDPDFTRSDMMKLRHWLFHWRVISLALENGAEIDMAKTGVRAITPDLRKPYLFPDKPCLETISALEENHSSMLHIIIKKIKDYPEISKLGEKEFADALQNMMGEQDNSLLESLVAVGEKQRTEPHHNAHLLPYLIHQAVFKADGQENAKPLLPMPGSSGKSLRDFFRDQFEMPGENKKISASKKEETPIDELPETKPLETLVWAKDDKRAQALENYIADRVRQLHQSRTDIPADRYPEELIHDEQGIYFFKEILKFMHYASEVSISDTLDSFAAKTPDALKEQLISILGEEHLLYFLTHYSRKHYDSKSGRDINDINDFLFLNLVSDIFIDTCQSLCKANDVPGIKANLYTAPDADKQKQAEQAVRAYINYKSKLAEQAANIQKMKARYTYSLRNLQRRFSLVQAYDIMNAYNHGFSVSPLHNLAIPENTLKSLYVHLEDKKEKEG